MSGFYSKMLINIRNLYFNNSDDMKTILHGIFLDAADVHIIAYSHGISASYAFQPEVPFDFTFNLPSVVSPYQVPTSGVFYNESPQNN